ncbi:MAG: type II toxin-antitoxin system HigB family toxin [Bacteroidota bacterium]
MRIISTRRIKDFCLTHPNAESTCTEWIREVRQAEWENPNQLKNLYPSASILPKNRAVFRLGGGNYRLIVVIHYDRGIVYIRFIGTHAEYDKIDANTI